MPIEFYQELFQKFIDGSISAQSFETTFLQAFKAEPSRMSKELYTILETVFEAVDCYWEECLPGEETNYTISEVQLRKEVSQQLVKLALLEQKTDHQPLNLLTRLRNRVGRFLTVFKSKANP